MDIKLRELARKINFFTNIYGDLDVIIKLDKDISPEENIGIWDIKLDDNGAKLEIVLSEEIIKSYYAK